MSSEFDPSRASPEEFLAYLQQKLAPRWYAPLKKISTLEDVDMYLQETYNLDPSDKKKLEEIKEELKEKESVEMPTDMQGIWQYIIIKGLTDRVLKILSKQNINIKEKIVIGTLPTGEVNAVAIQVPSGGFIVALNDGIFLFIHLLAKAVTSFFPFKKEEGKLLSFSTDEKDINRSLETNRKGHIRFVDVLFSYLVLGDARNAEQYFQKTEQRILTDVIRNTAEMFIIAHEYSHVILEHSTPAKSLTKTLFHQVKVKKIIRSWKDELNADNLALQIVLAHNSEQGLDLALSNIGIDFFFSCLEIVEQAIGISSIASHPSVTIRRECIREWIKETFPERSKSCLGLAMDFQKLIEELWKINKASFEKKASAYESFKKS